MLYWIKKSDQKSGLKQHYKISPINWKKQTFQTDKRIWNQNMKGKLELE